MKSKIKFTYSYFVDEATFLDSIIKLNPFHLSVTSRVEISYLICSVHQMLFSMRMQQWLKYVKLTAGTISKKLYSRARLPSVSPY